MRKLILLTAALFSATPHFAAEAPAPDTSTWVKFTAFDYRGASKIIPQPGDYQNPIVAGFYPDPSICRVGDDYYLVNSSFAYFPGLPIWHSKDLVHWTQIGNAIDRPSQFPFKTGPVQSGMYAPTIRHHDGTFYLVCTLVGGGGNFFITAKDPKGPWSDLVLLRDVGGIDPSLFFDDDGKCYVTSCEGPVGQALYNGHRTIRLRELDLAQGKTVGEATILVNGGTDITKNPIWCEAPHLYKIKGTYYLMCAEGGTGTDHSEVVFKSASVRGPFVPWEKNPILTARDLPAARPDPVTCAGHADLVQTQNGEWFAVFLACRPYQAGFYNLGRETFLLPVTWQNDWPVILPPKTPVPFTVKKPNLPAGTAATATTGAISFTDHFDTDHLAPRWMGLRMPASKWFVTSRTAKALYLEPRADRVSGQGNPSFLAVRQQNNDFTCAVTLTAQPKTIDCTAGLMAFQNETHFYALNVRVEAGRLKEISLTQAPPRAGRGRAGGAAGVAPTSPPSPPAPLAVQALPATLASLELKVEGAGPVTRFFYKTGTGGFVQIGSDLSSSYLSTETAGGFQGVTLGVFAHD